MRSIYSNYLLLKSNTSAKTSAPFEPLAFVAEPSSINNGGRPTGDVLPGTAVNGTAVNQPCDTAGQQIKPISGDPAMAGSFLFDIRPQFMGHLPFNVPATASQGIKKLSVMKNFLRKSGIFAVALLMVNLFLFNNAIGQSATTLSYTGSQQTLTIPTGVTSITVEAWGGGGHGGFND